MKADKISISQWMTLLFVALLTPAIHTLPAKPAAEAGYAGWLAPLAGLVPLVLMAVLLCATLEQLPEGAGMYELFVEALGKMAGKVVGAVYLLWLLVSMALGVRLYGERFLSTTYRDVSIGVFLVVLLLLAGWMSMGSLSALARFGKMAFYVMVATLTVVLVLAVPNIHLENLLPVWWDDGSVVIESAGSVLGSLEYGFIALFLAGQVRREHRGRWTAAGWVVGYCLLLMVISLTTMGCFGESLVSRMKAPFFSLAKEIELLGIIGRAESLVVALWVLTDVALMALLIKVSCRLLDGIVGRKRGERCALPITVLLFPGAMLISKSALGLEEFSRIWYDVYGLALVYVGLPILCLIVWAKRLWRKRHSV